MEHLRRRTLLWGGAASLLPTVARALPPSRQFLPSPVLPDPDKINLKFAEGYRPFRSQGYVIDGEKLGDKFLFHDYGHGGAGITTSWGSAQILLERMASAGLVVPDATVAVIGSGVIGMTAASVLKNAKMKVTVYSRESYERTTSHVAGGQFAPADLPISNHEEVTRVLRTSYVEHLRRGEKFGVQARMNYTLRQSENLLRAVAASGHPIDFADPGRHRPFRLGRLPFEHMNVSGYAYPTLLVEPPIFLAQLHRELRQQKVEFRQFTVVDQSSVMSLPEGIIVNCLGAGARLLAPEDAALQPAHGIVAILPPQPALRYLFSGIGYFFPRKNDIVIGGSFEQGNSSGRLSSQDKARLMVKVANAVFQGALPMPTWLVGTDQTVSDMLRSVEDN